MSKRKGKRKREEEKAKGKEGKRESGREIEEEKRKRKKEEENRKREKAKSQNYICCSFCFCVSLLKHFIAFFLILPHLALCLGLLPSTTPVPMKKVMVFARFCTRLGDRCFVFLSPEEREPTVGT